MGCQGWYFVTICTKNRLHYFGVETHNCASLQHTATGMIANEYWLQIPQHYPFVQLDAFVIMPNLSTIKLLNQSTIHIRLKNASLNNPMLPPVCRKTPRPGNAISCRAHRAFPVYTGSNRMPVCAMELFTKSIRKSVVLA